MPLTSENNAGWRIYSLISELFPVTLSITGEGVPESLEIIRKYLPGMKIESIPSGEKVFDWEVPNKWNSRSAMKILKEF